MASSSLNPQDTLSTIEFDGGVSAACAAEMAYEQIRQAILHGEIPVGSLLPQTSLAAALGMSRTPVRHALQMLVEEGLLEQTRRRQLQVKGISRERRREIVLARQALERISVSVACQVMRPEDIDFLRLVISRQRRAAEAGKRGEFIDADEEFHLEIAGRSRLPLIFGLLTQVGTSLRLMGIVALGEPARMAQVIEEHEAILSGIERGDPPAALTALTAHLRATEQALASGDA